MIKFPAYFIALSIITVSACSQRKAPVDADGRPLIVKLGTIDVNIIEATPVVFKSKLYRFEYIRTTYWDNKTDTTYFRFTDHETGEPTDSFAEGYHFGSATVYNDSIYVTGSNGWGGDQIRLFVSGDMRNWKSRLVLDLPEYSLYNTSLTRGADDIFVLMYEAGKPKDIVGKRFTALFASSTDLINWESSPLNPVLKSSEEDKKIINDKISTDIFKKMIADENNCNNSDIDFCEFNGRLIINYCWGDQMHDDFLAEAYYEGSLKEFLKGWFPE